MSDDAIWVLIILQGRFPFDQKFRNEISGILRDKWNSIFRLVGPSRPRPSLPSFAKKYEINKGETNNGGLFASFSCFGVA